LTLQDAPVLSRLAGRREIADTTISIPHPYSEERARQWIAETADLFAKVKSVAFATQLKRDGNLVGATGLRDIDAEHSQAELGFWVAVECWGQGYATEAARAVVGFGFEQLGLNRIYAHHMVRNPASGRVLARIGLKPEGLLRQRVQKWGVFEDVVPLALLREEWAQPFKC
jgi:[ribosomal protein S5]-alanine N-acetyltransferase